MDDVDYHADLLAKLAEIRPGKAGRPRVDNRGRRQFSPALTAHQRHCFDALVQMIEETGCTPTTMQLSLRLGWPAERVYRVLLQLARRGWVSVESSTPAQPERTDSHRGKWFPTAAAVAGEHIYDLLELAIELSQSWTLAGWNARAKSDVAAIRGRAQTIVRKIAIRAERCTRSPID